jgi:DNA modification methylase
MERLIQRGLRNTVRPSGHAIKGSFASNQGGSIPPNLIQCGNNESNSAYIRGSKENNLPIHPARYPAELPRFFIKFLTEPGDLVFDPFAGSNTTGAVAENLRRKWMSVEIRSDYATNSELRFKGKAAVEEMREPIGNSNDLPLVGKAQTGGTESLFSDNEE